MANEGRSVTSDESIASAVRMIGLKYGRLDVLVNSAAIDEGGVTGLALRKIYKDIFDVNTFGAAVTTEAFLPLLNKSSAPRIVFMSSELGSLAASSEKFPVLLPVFRSSKSALNMIMLHYAKKHKEKKWKINASCPGFVVTDMNKYTGPGTPESGAVNVVRLATLGEDGETGTFTNAEGPIAW